MSTWKRMALPGLAAVALSAGFAYAQQSGGPRDRGDGGERGERFERPRMSQQSIQRLQEGKLAMAKATLKLTPEQERLWAPVEKYVQDGWALRAQRFEEMRRERRESRQSGGDSQIDFVGRMERASQRMSERAERMKGFIVVLKPFYASLNEEQKAVVGPVLAEMSGMRGGKRFAGMHGGGRHGGMGWDGRGGFGEERGHRGPGGHGGPGGGRL
jgi:hypothetical protein